MIEPERQRLVGRLLIVGWLLIAWQTAAKVPARGQDVDFDAPGVKWILVPLDRREAWPQGDWKPIRKSQLKTLKTPPTASDRDGDFAVRRAVYRATLTDDSLLSGELTMSVHRSGAATKTVGLEPLGLSVTALTWDDAPAEWGTAPDGRLVVECPSDQGALTGQWMLRGERRADGLLFDIEVARAAGSRLALTLPERFTVHCRNGIIDPPQKAETAGWTVWNIELGRATRCRLILEETTPAQPHQPLVVVSDIFTNYTAAPEQFRIQTNLRLDVLESPLSELKFVTDPDVQIHAVVAAGEAALPMQQTEIDDQSVTTVRFDPPLSGLGHLLKLQATAPLTMERQIPLPQITIAGAVVGQGRINLNVQAPFQLKKITPPDDYRQVDASSGGNAVAFQYYGTARPITAVMGWSPLKVACRVFSHLRPARDQWETRSELRWESRSGERFALRCELPTDWEVTQVALQASGGDSAQADDWLIEPGPDGRRVLVVNLRESLSTTNPVTMEVITVRPTTAQHEALEIPTPIPLDADDVETLFSVTNSETTQPALELGSSYSPISTPRVPAIWRRFPLWSVATQLDGPSLMFLSTEVRPSGHFHFLTDDVPLNVVAKVRMTLSDDRAEELFRVDGNAATPTLSRIHVFINEPGPEIEWRLEGADASALKLRKLLTSRHRALDLPRYGELWEIQFTTPVPSTFSLTGRRTRAFSAAGQASLIFIPRSKTFRGTLDVVSQTPVPPRFSAQNLTEHPDADLTARPEADGAKTYRWSYNTVTAGLRIETEPESGGLQQPTITSVIVHSQISPAAEGQDLHWAVVDLTAFSETGDLEWVLPDTADPGYVLANDQTVEPFRVGDNYRLQRGTLGRAEMVTIHYRTSSAGRSGPGALQIPIPQFKAPVLQFSWRTACPPGTEMQILNSNARNNTAQVSKSWQTRLFGPLAQPTPTTADANEAAVQAAAAAAIDHPAAVPPPPPGWRRWKIDFSSPPTMISAAIWNVGRNRFIATALMASCLILAAGLRAAGWPFRRRFVAVWLGLCVLLAAWVPAAYAEIAGGVVIGSLLACLLPLMENLLRREPARPDESLPPGSTRRFTPVGTACVLAAFCCSQALAQESSLSTAETPPAPTRRVLIPYDANDPLGRKSDWVYVEPRTWKELQRDENQRIDRPAYLLRSARYELELMPQGGNFCRMQFEIDVLAAGEEVTVRLPLANVNLSADDPCRVNGQPHPISRDSETGELMLRLAGPVTATGDSKTAPDTPQNVRHTVDLSARIAGDKVDNGHHLRWNMPAIADSRLLIKLPAEEPYALISPDDRPPFSIHRHNDGTPSSIAVGHTSLMDVIWSAEPVTTTTRMEASTVCVGEVTPSLVRYRAQMKYRVLQGAVNHLRWPLPPGVAVDLIQGKHVTGYRLAEDDQGNRNVIVELDAADTEQIDITAQFVLPRTTEPENPVVPALSLSPLGTTIVEGNAPSHIFAVAAPPEFEIAVTPVDVAAVTALEKREFLDRWNDNAAPVRAVYAVRGAADFSVRLKRLAPQRTVMTMFRGRISRHHLDWELTVDVTVRSALAFQHRMQVDPRLRIETISVQQDDAERLQRYTRTRDQLELFLKTGAIGNQTIRITGTMPLKFPGEFALPSVGFFDANLASAEINLWQDNDLSVILSGIEAEQTIPPHKKWEAITENDLLVGRYQVPSGIDMEQVLVTIDKNSPNIVMDALNVIDMRVGVQKMTTVLWFKVESGHASEFAVRIPKQFEETCEVISPVTSRKESRDDGLELTFLPETPRQREMIVHLSFPIEPDEDGRLVIDEIFPVNAATGDVYVQTIDDDESFGPAAEYSGLTEDEMPAKFAPWIPVDTPTAYTKSFRGESGPWRFRSRHSPAQDALTIELADTRLWLDNSLGLVGHTSFLIMPGDEEQFVVTMPLGAQVHAVQTEQGETAASRVEGQEVTITLDAAQVGQLVTVYWSQPANHSGFWERLYRKIDCPTPQPRDFTVRQTAIAVIPAAHVGLTQTGDAGGPTNFEHALIRLDAEFRLCRAQTSAGHPRQKLLWERLAGRYRQAADEFARQSNGKAPPQLRTAFDDLRLRIETQLQQLQSLEMTPTESEALTAELMTDDVTFPAGTRHEIFEQKGQQTAQIAVTAYDERLKPAAMTLAVIVVVFLLRRLLRRRINLDTTAAWITEHAWVVWIGVGFLWWQLLHPAWLGLAVIAVAAAAKLAQRRRRRTETGTEVDFVMTVPTTDSGNS